MENPGFPSEFSRLCTLGDLDPTVGGCQKEAGKFRIRSGIWIVRQLLL
jgi:hypothetical protein